MPLRDLPEPALSAYPFNGHEGAHAFPQAEQLRWLSVLMPATRAPQPAT